MRISPPSHFAVTVVSFSLLAGTPLPAADSTFLELDPGRIQEISSWLPAHPAGLGKPITDRSYWTDPVTIQRCSGIAKRAQNYMKRDLPPFDDTAYLEFSKNGQRPAGEKMMKARSSFLAPLVLAECLENHGDYLPKINQVLQAYVDQPTWTLPAHDRNLGSYHKTHYDIDLGSSAFAFNLAEALYLLGDKIDPTVRQNCVAALQQRIFDPFKMAITDKSAKTCWWLKAQMNWNAVCLAGSIGAAESILPDRNERAVFAAAGEHYSKNYPRSYSDDGYDTEGVGYWGYGFGHFIILRAVLLNSTGGKLDLFQDPQSANMALFGVQCRIGEHAVAPFADCQFGVTPDTGLLAYSNESLQLGLNLPSYLDTKPSAELISVFIRPATGTGNKGTPVKIDPLRTFFEDVGILVCRPPQSGNCQMGIGIKAAGNGAHSHNDIGSYEIAIGDDEPTGDPGGPKVYNGETFGPKRYTYKILNSYGHPVPMVNGQLQIEAAKAYPKVLESHFSNETDSLKLEMTSAYAVKELSSLVRTMTYSRSGKGQVEIIDQFNCTKIIPLEEALITHGKWERLDPTSFLLSIGNARLKVTVTVPGGFRLKTETIQELDANAFTRLSLYLKAPSAETEVRMVFTPQ